MMNTAHLREQAMVAAEMARRNGWSATADDLEAFAAALLASMDEHAQRPRRRNVSRPKVVPRPPSQP